MALDTGLHGIEPTTSYAVWKPTNAMCVLNLSVCFLQATLVGLLEGAAKKKD
jgi:hypothetical protein